MVGVIEPEVHSWLSAARHEARRVRLVDDALVALEETPADLVIADREPAGRIVVGPAHAVHGSQALDGGQQIALRFGIRRGGPHHVRRHRQGLRRLLVP